MIFRDDREREAWLEVAKIVLEDGHTRPIAISTADGMIEAMREREAKPASVPISPATINIPSVFGPNTCGPQDGFVLRTISTAPDPVRPESTAESLARRNAAQPAAPVRGERERLEKLLNRLTEQSWTPSGASLPMVDTVLMTAFFKKVIADLPPDDQRLATIVAQAANSGAPAVSIRAPSPRSERPALERVRADVQGKLAYSGTVSINYVLTTIDAELARQPPGDTLAVENLIAKVRLLLSNEGNVAMLRAALAVLDRVRGKA